MRDGQPPNSLPRPAGELQALERAWKAPDGWRRLSAVNNSHIGVFYIATALLFFILAGVLALVMRTQLAVPGNTLVSAATYNQLFTMHGTVMMFLFAVPIVEAVAVYLLPGMLGARDLPFPRLSAYAFWAYAIGGIAFFCTIFFGASPDGGWVMYPPLPGKQHSPGIGADWWLLGIGFIEISAIAGAIELIIGILFTRAPGMTLARMPVFAWALLVSAFMIVFAFPAIIAGTLLLELERAFDWPFFIAARGGDPVLWQHLFWFFGHPEVYIMILPAFGIVSQVVPAFARKRLFGYASMVYATSSIAILSFIVWAHHMFTTGMPVTGQLFFMYATMLIAVPTAVKIFNWIATMWQGSMTFETPMLWAVGFIFVFTMGGFTGLILSMAPVDQQLQDTYYVVAHFHYVLVAGSLYALFAGVYYWGPKWTGVMYSETRGKIHFWGSLIFFNITFFPMHFLGLAGMPRRYADYPMQFADFNAIASVGAFFFGFAQVYFFFFVVLPTMRGKGEKAPQRPWNDPDGTGAEGLEWEVASPAPFHTFETPPRLDATATKVLAY